MHLVQQYNTEEDARSLELKREHSHMQGTRTHISETYNKRVMGGKHKYTHRGRVGGMGRHADAWGCGPHIHAFSCILSLVGLGTGGCSQTFLITL